VKYGPDISLKLKDNLFEFKQKPVAIFVIPILYTLTGKASGSNHFSPQRIDPLWPELNTYRLIHFT
jgi:hypothetical protein